MRRLVCTDVELQDAIDQNYGYQMSIDGILRELETGELDAVSLNAEQQGYVNPKPRSSRGSSDFALSRMRMTMFSPCTVG